MESPAINNPNTYARGDCAVPTAAATIGNLQRDLPGNIGVIIGAGIVTLTGRLPELGDWRT